MNERPEDGTSVHGLTSRRFLLAILDGGGTVPPALGLAAELVRRGHVVRVLADPTVAASAQAAGCAFTPWRLAPHFASVAEQTALIAQMEGRNPYRQLRIVNERMMAGPVASYAGEVLRTAVDHAADVLLVEAALPGVLIGALATRLPTAALMANIYLRPTPGLPLMGTGWSPPTGPLGRVRDHLAASAVNRITSLWLPALNRELATHGLSPLTNVFELLDRCTRVLVMTSPSFDFGSTQLPDNVRYVGPQVDDPDWATTDDDWRPPGDDPLVLVSLSSIFQHQAPLLRRIVAALDTLPVRALVTTGRAVDPAELDAPGNVRVVAAAPHRRVLAEAAAVVTHAGHGTVLKTLAAGVPLVCLPMGRDQRDNTTRVVRLGAGLRVPQRARPEQIAAAVRLVLNDPRYTEAARRFASVLAEEARSRPSAADEAEHLAVRPVKRESESP